MATIDEEQRLKFLMRARAKKAQPDAKVDVLSKLEIAEGDKKKKRKADSGRISVPIPGKGSSSVAAVDEAIEAEGETKVRSPPQKKRSLNKKRKTTKMCWSWR
jgi:hypothetical protein